MGVGYTIMKEIVKVIAFITASVVGLATIALGALFASLKIAYHLPSERYALYQFTMYRADYLQFVELVKKDPSARFVDGDGGVYIGSVKRRLNPEYRRLIRNIGAKFVQVADDGSVEFALWGFGCAICSDSYMGMLYVPKGYQAGEGGLQETAVSSLDSSKLPQENGSVATGLYVVPIEPNWFIYRFEYQE
jgi:hypothetical protein